MTTLRAPNGVTKMACVKAYAIKLHSSPTITKLNEIKKNEFQNLMHYTEQATICQKLRQKNKRENEIKYFT